MNVINGMTFGAEFNIFSPGRKGKFLGTAEVSGIVVNDSSYDSNYKHWIYFVVTKSDSDKFIIGKQYKKQGKNFYPAVYNYSYPEDQDKKAEIKNMRKIAAGIVPQY